MHLSSVAAGSALTRSCEQPVSPCFPVRSVSAVPAKCCSWLFLLVQSCSLYASLGFQHHKRTGRCGKGEHSASTPLEQQIASSSVPGKESGEESVTQGAWKLKLVDIKLVLI